VHVPVDPAAPVPEQLEVARRWLGRRTVREVPAEGTPVRLPVGWAAPVLELPATEADPQRRFVILQAPTGASPQQDLWVNPYRDGLAAVPVPPGAIGPDLGAFPFGSLVVYEMGQLNEDPPDSSAVAGVDRTAPESLLSLDNGRLTAEEYAERLEPDAAGNPPVVVLYNHVVRDAMAPFVAALKHHATVVFRLMPDATVASTQGERVAEQVLQIPPPGQVQFGRATEAEWRAISSGSEPRINTSLPRLLGAVTVDLEGELRRLVEDGVSRYPQRFLAELLIDRLNEPRSSWCCGSSRRGLTGLLILLCGRPGS